jgi:hypothetical protein
MLDKMNAVLSELDYPAVGPGWEIGCSKPNASTEQPEPNTASDGGEPATDLLVREIFATHFPRLLQKNVDRLSFIKGTYKFVITGGGGGTWTIDLRDSEHRISNEDGEADCTIMVEGDDLVRMVGGKLNAASASMDGRLRVAGDSRLALMIGPILLGT